jgi:hypothetical protein
MHIAGDSRIGRWAASAGASLTLPGSFHVWLTLALLVLLVPACLLTHLRVSPPPSVHLFLLGWGLHSVICAAVLFQLGTVGAWQHFRREPLRIIPALLMSGVLLFVFGWQAGALLAIVLLAILEFYYRKGNWKAVASALVPWLYLATGIELSLYFSSIIVALRPCTEYDAFFSRIDKVLMLGTSVVDISRASVALYTPAALIYSGIGGVMGAAILFFCIAGERDTAFRMCGAILTAYYLSLVLFFLFPAQGPFVTAGLPPQLLTAAMQSASLANATRLYHHAGWMDPALGYYVAFPSLHVAQPLIAAWYLRRWPRVSGIVFGYCVLLVPAIVILRWHYIVDILGGLAVAAIAVWLIEAAQRTVSVPAAHKYLVPHRTPTTSEAGG